MHTKNPHLTNGRNSEMDTIRAMVLGCLQDEMKHRCAEDDFLFGVHEEDYQEIRGCFVG